MLALARRFSQIAYIRYLIVSVGALFVDLGSFLALIWLETSATLAAVISYCLGIGASWILSSRKVFADQTAKGGVRRVVQKTMFLGSALVGLIITTAIVWLCDRSDLNPHLAKMIAVAASFQITWLLRSKVIFSSSRGLA